MSAGTGVRHSEFNASDSDPVHFLQIWILPEEKGLAPGYEQRTFAAEEKNGKLRLVGSRDGREGSVTIHRDVDLYAALLEDGDTLGHAFANGRNGWVQIARGSVLLNGNQLYPGDGVAIEVQAEITLTGTSAAEVLLFDMG
jgi:hypothetical protein